MFKGIWAKGFQMGLSSIEYLDQNGRVGLRGCYCATWLVVWNICSLFKSKAKLEVQMIWDEWKGKVSMASMPAGKQKTIRNRTFEGDKVHIACIGTNKSYGPVTEWEVILHLLLQGRCAGTTVISSKMAMKTLEGNAVGTKINNKKTILCSWKFDQSLSCTWKKISMVHISN